MKPHIPFPKTRLEDHLEYNKEVAVAVRMAAIRTESGIAAETQHQRLTEKIDKIYAQYRDKFFAEDLHCFNFLPDLEKFLREELELKEYRVKEAIRHEKKHVNMLMELGYTLKGYGCILLKTDKTRNGMTYAVFTRFYYDKIMSLKDLGEIANAPRNPSIIDKFHPREYQ